MRNSIIRVHNWCVIWCIAASRCVYHQKRSSDRIHYELVSLAAGTCQLRSLVATCKHIQEKRHTPFITLANKNSRKSRDSEHIFAPVKRADSFLNRRSSCFCRGSIGAPNRRSFYFPPKELMGRGQRHPGMKVNEFCEVLSWRGQKPTPYRFGKVPVILTNFRKSHHSKYVSERFKWANIVSKTIVFRGFGVDPTYLELKIHGIYALRPKCNRQREPLWVRTSVILTNALDIVNPKIFIDFHY